MALPKVKFFYVLLSPIAHAGILSAGGDSATGTQLASPTAGSPLAWPTASPVKRIRDEYVPLLDRRENVVIGSGLYGRVNASASGPAAALNLEHVLSPEDWLRIFRSDETRAPNTRSEYDSHPGSAVALTLPDMNNLSNAAAVLALGSPPGQMFNENERSYQKLQDPSFVLSYMRMDGRRNQWTFRAIPRFAIGVPNPLRRLILESGQRPILTLNEPSLSPMANKIYDRGGLKVDYLFSPKNLINLVHSVGKAYQVEVLGRMQLSKLPTQFTDKAKWPWANDSSLKYSPTAPAPAPLFSMLNDVNTNADVTMKYERPIDTVSISAGYGRTPQLDAITKEEALAVHQYMLVTRKQYLAVVATVSDWFDKCMEEVVVKIHKDPGAMRSLKGWLKFEANYWYERALEQLQYVLQAGPEYQESAKQLSTTATVSRGRIFRREE